VCVYECVCVCVCVRERERERLVLEDLEPRDWKMYLVSVNSSWGEGGGVCEKGVGCSERRGGKWVTRFSQLLCPPPVFSALARIVDRRQVLELCQTSLAETLDKFVFHDQITNAVRTDLVLAVLIDVASGCMHIHSKNIIWGDLKPENVLLKVREEGMRGASEGWGNGRNE
jgi:hypothetical protein